ncbi:MAG: cobalt-precorrin-6A reductase [Magnetovibrionaceae bacterium]
MNVLILGGTTEARLLAEAAADRGHRVTTSLAGRTQAPRLPAGAVVSGGFGGVHGLKAFLDQERIEALIDATHPFAATISTSARQAACEANVAFLQLERRPWRRQRGDRWTMVNSPARAALRLASGRYGSRPLLTLGAQELAPFRALPGWALGGRTTVARLIEPVADPGRLLLLSARGPFSLEDELNLMAELGTTVLVTKNAGGDATAPKLTAARLLGLPVIMIRRPAPPRPGSVETVKAALAWLSRQTGGDIYSSG